MLPLPPSVNRLWRAGRGRVYRSAAYLQWQHAAGWELAAQRPPTFPAGTSIAVRIRAGRPNRRRDLDNIAKALLDLLQRHRILADDSAVVDMRLAWDDAIAPGHVQIEGRAIEKTAA